MSVSNSTETPKVARRIFGEQSDSPLDEEYGTPNSTGLSVQRPYTSSNPQPQRPIRDEENGLMSAAHSERPPIPSALASSGEAASTPLPILSMIVLSITMLGEFLSANVSTPFLLFMVEGFGTIKEEGDIGYWTGILVSCFFITQFLTSLLWATAAERHGARAVLFVSLLGSSLTCCFFGTSTSLKQAMAIRLLQGIFAGAIGVGRGSVVSITDSTNEGRAYSILGFCWGFGGVAGAIIGGSFESAASKWPNIFAEVPIIVKYPYLLPCAIASSVTFSGAIMCLFLGHDAGPRDGAIRLPPEKGTVDDTIPEESVSPMFDEFESPGLMNQWKQSLSRKFPGYFARRVPDFPASPSPPGPSAPVPLSTAGLTGNKARTFSRTSRLSGSAYGYNPASFRKRLHSNVSMRLAGRRGSLASTVGRRRGSVSARHPSMNAEVGEQPNFAQRLLLANENAVTNIADLWVAAAINADNEDPFEESDTDEEFEELGENRAGDFLDTDPFLDDVFNEESSSLVATSMKPRQGSNSRMLTVPPPRFPSVSHRPSTSRPKMPFGSPRRPSLAVNQPVRSRLSSQATAAPDMPRRSSSNVPTIFSHVGVRVPSATHERTQQTRQQIIPTSGSRGQLKIPQQTRVMEEPIVETVSEKRPLLQLPIFIIIQYGLLALHSTTHDQVFLSYLVSKYEAGGLNLNAGHFAELIALMSLAQIAYQFYLYPNMGPPRGRFSHLAMFRIGSLLFIPAYLTVILYHPLASSSEDGNLVLMAALAVSNALRYCGITFAYTAISILLNYTSPPHLLGLANGMAQSIVSLSRFFGPILGGLLWSVSVDGNPSGYPLGFLVCAGITVLAVSTSFFIR